MNGILISSSHVKSLVELIGVLIIFVFVLAITYFTTRWMGGFQKTKLRNKNMNIVETISVGNNKMISIIAVGKKYIIVSIGKDNVQYLTEITEEDLVDLSFKEDPVKSTESFQDVFSKIKDKLPKK